MSESNTSSESSPIKSENMESAKGKKNVHIQAKNTSPVITGIFWIAVGIIMLVVNFFSNSTSISLIKFIRNWGMLIAGMYLLLFSLLGYMRKIYFIFAIVVIALWLGHAIERLSVKIRWPIIMIVISLAIIFYGLVFKKHKFKSYLIVGCIFLVFSLLVLISISHSFNLSQFLKKGWPVFLIFLGFSYIYNRKNDTKIERRKTKNHAEGNNNNAD